MKACDFVEAGELMLELKNCNSISWLWMTSCFPWYDVQTNRMKDTCRKRLNICDNILHCDDAGLWREIEPHVCFLVCPKWPCQHRNSCAHGLERGIPATVRQESPGGLV